MAQSRGQKGKGKKSKFPMWGIGIVVVLVVAIAGYAIVRLSHAGGSGGSSADYPVSALQGSKGAYTTTISKSNGTKMTVWALPKGESLYLFPSANLTYLYNGRRLNYCASAQRLNGDIGQANINGSGFYPSGSGQQVSATLNIGVAKQYCSGDIGQYVNLAVPPGSYFIKYMGITNDSNYPLYVTSLGYSY